MIRRNIVLMGMNSIEKSLGLTRFSIKQTEACGSTHPHKSDSMMWVNIRSGLRDKLNLTRDFSHPAYFDCSRLPATARFGVACSHDVTPKASGQMLLRSNGACTANRHVLALFYRNLP